MTEVLEVRLEIIGKIKKHIEKQMMVSPLINGQI